MIQAKRMLHTLEYNKILQMLASVAPTAGAKEMALALLPDDDRVAVCRSLQRTADARRLLADKGMPSFGSVTDIADALERAGKGSTLTTRELLDIGNVLRTARGLLDYSRVNRHFKRFWTRSLSVCCRIGGWRTGSTAPSSPRM